MATGDDRIPAVQTSHLDEVPVDICFELGAASLPLGELRAIGEGQVFRLARNIQEAVDIRFSGELIGHGELVLVDDVLAVRVTRVAVR